MENVLELGLVLEGTHTIEVLRLLAIVLPPQVLLSPPYAAERKFISI
jgi:hypothetical protein